MFSQTYSTYHIIDVLFFIEKIFEILHVSLVSLACESACTVAACWVKLFCILLNDQKTVAKN